MKSSAFQTGVRRARNPRRVGAATAVSGTGSTIDASVFYHFDKYPGLDLASDNKKLENGFFLRSDGSPWTVRADRE